MRFLVASGLALPFALMLPMTAQAERTIAERSSALTLTLAPYRPDIDAQLGAAAAPGPYEQSFGSDRNMMFQIGWEGHFIKNYGALTGGLSAGYWSVDGKSILDTGGSGGDSTAMQILPLSGQISYRFDMFADAFPLAPIARLGVDYYLWRILDGSDEVAQFSSGNDAMGGTYGWHAGIGVHLLLDFFAPEMATDFERDAGVFNSFLTAEYRYAQVDDFGSASSFRLGDGSFVFGLTLEL